MKIFKNFFNSNSSVALLTGYLLPTHPLSCQCICPPYALALSALPAVLCHRVRWITDVKAILKELFMSLMNSKPANAAKAMEEAKASLDAQNIPYLYLPPYQLKIGAINFWPGTGTITVDGESGKRPGKGLSGLESMLVADKAPSVHVNPSSAAVARSRLRMLE
jgi:hypothetical protein